MTRYQSSIITAAVALAISIPLPSSADREFRDQYGNLVYRWESAQPNQTIVRDQYGNMIGTRDRNGNHIELRDRYGNSVGDEYIEREE